MTRATLCCALALAVPGQGALPSAATAQQRHMPRQWLYAATGTALGLGITLFYSGRNYNKSLGWCSSAKCVGIVTTTTTTLVGYMIGHELEQKYQTRYRLAPPVEMMNRTRILRSRATGLELDGGLVAVMGDDGIELVSAEPRLDYLGQRARGLRDITDVGLRASAASMVVGTGTGLYLYSVSAQGDGQRSLSGEVSAVAARGNRVAVATAGLVRIGIVTGDSVAWRADSNPVPARVADLRWENDTLLWVLTEEALTAYAMPADSGLLRLGSVALRGPARRLAVLPGVIAVAAGAEGAYVVRTADPTALQVEAHWSEPRYVYDVALWRDSDAGPPRLFVGAGPEGLYILKHDGLQLQAVGLVSNVGFVAALAAGPDALYALDRTGGVLRRIDPRAPTPEN